MFNLGGTAPMATQKSAVAIIVIASIVALCNAQTMPATQVVVDASALKPGLRDPAKREIAMQLVSSAENSSLDWKAQYAYIEYNVEHNEAENRGYTAGIIGFTSKTHDMLEVVRYYNQLSP